MMHSTHAPGLICATLMHVHQKRNYIYTCMYVYL